MRPINIISGVHDWLMPALETRLAQSHRAASLTELRRLLVGMPTPDPLEAATLDLIGHSASGARLLQLGESLIDMCDRRVESFFEGLVRDRVLARLGIVQLRLLGCHTAVEPGGLLAMRRLAATLRMPVFGTTTALLRSHYDRRGFNPCFGRVLVEAAPIVRARAPRPRELVGVGTV